jgi:hypothetical protein
MAVTYTLTYADDSGPLRTRSGTFTSADGDGNGETLTVTTHGLDYIQSAVVRLTAVGAQVPRITTSGGTVTWTVDNTGGASGVWELKGL